MIVLVMGVSLAVAKVCYELIEKRLGGRIKRMLV